MDDCSSCSYGFPFFSVSVAGFLGDHVGDSPTDSLLTDRDTSHDTSLIFDAAVSRRNRKSMARRCHCRSSSCAVAQSSKLHDERREPVPRRIKLIGPWDIASAVPRS